MSQSGESFDTIQESLKAILSDKAAYEFSRGQRALVLEMPTDVAAFAVFNGHVQEEFDAAYREFKSFYRERHIEWDKRTLSFVLCRASETSEHDRFYAEREHDPLFCRKYVIHAHGDIAHQREELLRLPFLPFPDDQDLELNRPRSAYELLQSTGVPASLTRKFIEPGRRAADGIVADLLDGAESLPEKLRHRDLPTNVFTRPRKITRLSEATIHSFRAYRKPQSFNLDASVVVLYGPNGLGKTSFFDAIDYACTGRIGRLCRQDQRNQEDFSRVATHLDDTPGTGSVILRGSTEQEAERRDWTLRRGTGNWSTAWIDGNKSSRIDTLTFLTNAVWGEARPRQQNVESLFRATHLFGQDEQELLIEFRRNSTIPEAFITEMLALQDYSGGLSKAKDVCQVLESRLGALKNQRTDLQKQKTALEQSIVVVPKAEDSPTEETIEQMASQLRGGIDSAHIKVRFPDQLPTADGLLRWLDLATAELGACRKRLAASQELRGLLPAFHSTAQKIAVDRESVTALDSQQQELASQVSSLQKQLQENNVKATSTNTLRVELVRRRRELEAAKKWLAERSDREQEMDLASSDRLASENDTRSSEATLAGLDAEISAAVESQQTRHAKIDSSESRLAALSQLLDSFPAYTTAEQEFAKIQEQLIQLAAQRTSHEQACNERERRVLAAEAERDQLAPEYEREKAQQSELVSLLDSIQCHVSGSKCPLCGTEFESDESLLESIRRHRELSLQDSSVASRYASLKTAVADAKERLEKATAARDALVKSESQLNTTLDALRKDRDDYAKKARAILNADSTRIDKTTIDAALSDIKDEVNGIKGAIQHGEQELAELRSRRDSAANVAKTQLDRTKALDEKCKTLDEAFMRHEVQVREVLAAEQITEQDIDTTIDALHEQSTAALQSIEHLRALSEQLSAQSQEADSRIAELTKRRNSMRDELTEAERQHSEIKSRLSTVQLPHTLSEADQIIRELERAVEQLDRAATEAQTLHDALSRMQARTRDEQTRQQISNLDVQMASVDDRVKLATSLLQRCQAVENLLRSERQQCVKNHISAYGPLISNIQQRLRSVYGFGGLHLEARGGEAAVQVEWRNKDIQLRPTDFFSDSQKQILMLSVFLAGGLRQSWSGFAPVLLDDPVTHFDDLNAYGFVELIRGIVASKPKEWQFVISTCEDRLFALMQKKFSRIDGGAIFYEFLGMSDDGPIVEQR